MTSNNKAPTRPRIVYHCRKPRRVRVEALTHLRDEQHPDDPLIPCTKLKGMWMCKSGGDVGAEYFITDGPRAILLTIDEATEEQKRCIGHVSHTRGA